MVLLNIICSKPIHFSATLVTSFSFRDVLIHFIYTKFSLSVHLLLELGLISKPEWQNKQANKTHHNRICILDCFHF